MQFYASKIPIPVQKIFRIHWKLLINMRFIFISLFVTFLTFCSATGQPIEPIGHKTPFIDELKLSINKMRDVLLRAPEENFQEKKQAFISLQELENEVQKLSNVFHKKRTILIQSSDETKEDEDEDSEENSKNQEETPTPEEAEELMRQLTTKIWKTTDEILRAYTGISGLVGALPPKTIT